MPKLDLWKITAKEPGKPGQGWTIWQFPLCTEKNTVEQCYAMAHPDRELVEVEFLRTEEVEE